MGFIYDMKSTYSTEYAETLSKTSCLGPGLPYTLLEGFLQESCAVPAAPAHDEVWVLGDI